MDAVLSYILIPFLNWGHYFFYLAALLLAANKRFGYLRRFSRPSYKFLIWLVAGFKVLYASVETFSQYYIWSGNGFTKLFLDKNVLDTGLLKEVSGKLYIFLWFI